MRSNRASRLTKLLTLLPTFSLAHCAMIGSPDPVPPTTAVPMECRAPNEAQARSLSLLAQLSLPHGKDGKALALAPGEPLPEGATPAVRPDLYEAAGWTTGQFCRCFPDRCEKAKTEPMPASAPVPPGPPTPTEAQSSGTPTAPSGQASK